MYWQLSACLNAVIAIAFIMIALTIARGLWQSGQLWSNKLGLATAAIFFTCAGGHATHAAHMLLPFLGIDVPEGLAARNSIDLHVELVDATTAAVALWYWTLRPKFASALGGGELFADLQRRFEDQSRVLASKGRIADALQRALSPKELPSNEALSFDATYVPAENDAQVGGDWYDVFALQDGRIAFMIGDITGHGLDAAAATIRAREAIIAAAFESPDPSSVLMRVNRLLCYRNAPIVTAIFGTIDPKTNHVLYATAGHPSPVLADRNTPATFLPHDGLPLGVEMSAEYPTFSVTVKPSSLLVVYTDGVTEFSRDLFDGESRLLRAVTHIATQTPVQPSCAILKKVFRGATPRDDIAMLSIKFLGKPAIIAGETMQQWSLDIVDPEAASRLRSRIISALRSKTTDICHFESAELIIGELLANVVQHAPGHVSVHCDWSSGACLLTVNDSGQGFTAANTGRVGSTLDDILLEDLSENGRGMLLVQALSEKTEILSNPNGTTIRVQLPGASKDHFDTHMLADSVVTLN